MSQRCITFSGYVYSEGLILFLSSIMWIGQPRAKSAFVGRGFIDNSYDNIKSSRVFVSAWNNQHVFQGNRWKARYWLFSEAQGQTCVQHMPVLLAYSVGMGGRPTLDQKERTEKRGDAQPLPTVSGSAVLKQHLPTQKVSWIHWQ